MADKKRDIRYINRDFNSFRNSLIEYTKTYFSNTFNDFTDSSTGMMFIEMSAYVGDVLSFYIDNQIQETFIQTARQIENLYNLSYMLGYRPKATTASTVELEIYQQLPAILISGSNVPDFSYCLKISENTQVNSNSDTTNKFLIGDRIDFSHSSSMDPTTISVFSVQGNQPTYFLLKKTRQAKSSTIQTTSFSFDSPEKFKTIDINDSNIIGILDVVDSEGNVWYEVPNLAQDSILETIRNTNPNDPNLSQDQTVLDVLKLKQVQRRFATRFINETKLQLQFGAGNTNIETEELIPNPENVGLGLPFGKDKLTTAFSPLNFMFTNTYGIAPYNTTLIVRYLKGGGLSSNVSSNTINSINGGISFVNSTVANSSLAQTIYNSLAVNNPKAADGGQDGDTIEEIRQNALGNFQNQLRTVTPQDYLIRSLSMPSNFGTIAKSHVTPSKVEDITPGETPTILDLYVLSYDSSKSLIQSSSTLKHNLQTYLYEYKMVNDSVNIKDAFIINIGVEFDIIVLPDYNNNEVLTKCIASIISYFEIDKWQINQPIILKDLYIMLDKIEGVQTVPNVNITNKTGVGYSEYAYDIKGATLKDVVYPSLDPMCFELKNPNSNVLGRVVPL